MALSLSSDPKTGAPIFPKVPKSLTGASDTTCIDVIIEEPMDYALQHPEEGPIYKTKEEALEKIKEEEGVDKAESGDEKGPEVTEMHFTWAESFFRG